MNRPRIDTAAQQRIDAHLDAIERALEAGGMTRAERHQIAEDVDAQIHEMLAARLGDRTAMLEDVQAVLSELDPPEAYGASPPTSEAASGAAASVYAGPAHVSRLAVVGAVWAPLGMLAILLLFMSLKVVPVAPGSEPGGPAWWQMVLIAAVLVPGLLAPIGATICGAVSLGAIRRSGGRVSGRVLGVFAAVFNPVVIIDGLVIVLSAWLWHEMGMRHGDHVRPKLILWTMITAGLVTLIAWLIIRAVWRASGDPPVTPPKPLTRTTMAMGIVSLACAVVYMAITAGTIVLATMRQAAEREGRALTGLLAVDAMSLFYLSLLLIVAGLVFGIAGWRHATGKVGAILCAALPVVSLLMMA